MNRVLELSRKLVWGLTGLSITSCLVRNDYNVIFSFLVLIILNNFYNQNPKLFTKIIIQMMAALIVIDVVWIGVMVPTWTHSSTDNNDYWKSLAGVHTFVTILAFLELILKGLILSYLAYDFKGKHPAEINELWKLSYLENLSSQKKPSSVTEESKQSNQGLSLGGESDFRNPY